MPVDGNHIRKWMAVYPEFAARLDARLEDDGQQAFLVFDVDTWEEANSVLYATTPKGTRPPQGE